MKAILWTRYGPPEALQLQEVDKPTPKADEVLIKTHAATVTTGDCEMRALRLPLWMGLPARAYVGILRPSRIKILGQELAGEIEAVGEGVKKFKPGDPVFALLGFYLGAYAEYTCLPEDPGALGGVLAIKPSNLTYEEAAAVPLGGLEALHFLRRGNIQNGEKLLVNGAGGSIGTMAVQLARTFGAEVTAVDSAPKLDMLRSLGAQRVIDYAQEDFTQSNRTYDVIFDVIGKSPFSRSLRCLNPNGRYILANPGLSHMLRGRWASRGGRQVIFGSASHKTEDLILIKDLVEAGHLRPVIDRRYPFDQTAAAHSYVETGQKQGSVVITVP